VRMPRSSRRATSKHAARSSAGLAGLAGLAVLASLVAPVGGDRAASAAPAPTVAQVKAKLARLSAIAGRLGQQYDQVLAQFAQANQRLALLDKQTAGYRARFESLQRQIGRIAALAYEQGGANSEIVLLTTATPQRVLNESSILTELASANSAQIHEYLAASRQLLSARQAAALVRAGIARIKHSLGARLKQLKALQAQQLALLATLTATQQVGIGPGGGSGGHYHGPTKTQAQKAVAFAYNQLGCPYVYGGTGPCRQGYDCSGLTMSAWAYAGISIPRVSYDQMSSLPAVALHTASGRFTTKYLRPGDILGFAGNSHVAIYVGGNELIDSPVPGQSVQKISLSGWYLTNLDGAARP
jgi:peptidoglycan DL-endopeptidase CwlO